MHESDERKWIRDAVDHRLSGLQADPFLARRIMNAEKGKEMVMKKKISVSVVLVLAIMLLTLSVGFAWVQSNIAHHLFGSEEDVPQGVLDQIQKPAQTVATALGKLTVDEVLYDGSALHTSFTIENPTDETLLYTVDGIWLGDERLSASDLRMEGAGSAGQLLGGTVNGTALPVRAALYNKGEFVYQHDADNHFLGYGQLPEGNMEMKIAVAVWRPIHTPEVVDYQQFEGVDVTTTLDHLAADASGCCQLYLFRPEKYNLNCTALDLSSQVYGEAYQKLGWAEVVDTMELTVQVNLDKDLLDHAAPKDDTYEQQNCKLTFVRFDMSQAGGEVEGWITGEYNAVKRLMENGVCLVDRAGNRVLSNGCIWDDQGMDSEGVHFTLTLAPMADKLPQQVYLAPVTAIDYRWDETQICYDASVEKPDGVVGVYQFDFARAFEMDLEMK